MTTQLLVERETNEQERGMDQGHLHLHTFSSRIGQSHRTQARHIPDATIESMLLLWLLHHPMQRLQDIALGLQVSYAVAHRHVGRLEGVGLVEGVTPSLNAGKKSRWYYLSNGGIKAATTQERADAKVLARAWGADEQGLLQLLPRFHLLAEMQEIVNGLMEHAPTVFAYAGGHPAEIAWVWVRDYQRQFVFHKRGASCYADAAVAFQRRARGSEQPEQYYCFFLFLDCGRTPFLNQDLITQRLLGLLRYRECEERIAHRTFPSILVVVQSPRQLSLWQQCAREVAVSLSISKPLSGAIVCLPPSRSGGKERSSGGRFTSSAWPLNWRELATNGACRLRDLLTPMEAADLPPGIRTRRVAAPKDVPAYKHLIVRGNFEERCKHLDMAPSSLAKERELVCLLGLEMSQRYRDIFLLLYVAPLLSTTELGLVLDEPRSTVQHYLERLQQWCLVQRVSNPGQQWRWVISDRGLRFLAAAFHVSVLHVMVPTKQRHPTEAECLDLGQRGVYMLHKYLLHTAGVYHFIAELHKAAQQNGHQVLWWEVGSRCERRYRSRGAWHNFRPDAIMEYDASPVRLLAWVEWDRGTMNGKGIRAKLESYKSYVLSGEWRRSRVQNLPLLLVVVPGKSQHDLIAHIVREVLGDLEILVRVTTVQRLEKFGVLAESWTHVHPNSGRENDRRRLLDLRVKGEEQDDVQ